MDQQLKMTEDECKDYRDFLEKLSRTEDDVDEEALDQELKQVHIFVQSDKGVILLRKKKKKWSRSDFQLAFCSVIGHGLIVC